MKGMLASFMAALTVAALLPADATVAQETATPEAAAPEPMYVDYGWDPVDQDEGEFDITRTSRELESRNGRTWITFDGETAQEPPPPYIWNVRIWLDTRGDEHGDYRVQMQVYDITNWSCRVYGRGIVRGGRRCKGWMQNLDFRIPGRWISRDKRIRWKLAVTDTDWKHQAGMDRAPDYGWYR